MCFVINPSSYNFLESSIVNWGVLNIYSTYSAPDNIQALNIFQLKINISW